MSDKKFKIECDVEDDDSVKNSEPECLAIQTPLVFIMHNSHLLFVIILPGILIFQEGTEYFFYSDRSSGSAAKRDATHIHLVLNPSSLSSQIMMPRLLAG